MSEPVKKGKPSWRPAKKLELTGKDEKLVYRWCDKDPFNLEKRRRDGWSIANKVNGADAELVGERPLTSVSEYRELVLMSIPKEDYEEHRAYYEEQTRNQTRGLKRDVQKKLGDEAARHGAKAAVVEGNITVIE